MVSLWNIKKKHFVKTVLLKHVFLKVIETNNFYLHLPYKMIVIVQTIIHVTNNSYVISV